MSKINLIQQFAYKCLNCNTCIRFDVPNPTDSKANDKINELSNTVNSLICPKCKTSLGSGASKAFDAVKSYNASATLLNISIANETIEIS